MHTTWFSSSPYFDLKPSDHYVFYVLWLTVCSYMILQFWVCHGSQVVNMKELQEVAPLGLPIYGFNLSVGLAVC
jgi:hypothetical protein